MNVIDQSIHARYSLYHADTVEVARALPDSSVDLSVFSPPFSSLYTYSPSERDLGNCADDSVFWQQYRFLINETLRVMKPGRLVAIHCMDLPSSKAMHGYIGLRDFPGDIIRVYSDAGFIYHSRICIWKDPVQAMQRTKALGLLHKTIRSDSAMSRQGIPDSVIVMRKPGSNPDPITHTHEEFPVARWQRYASPVWALLEGDNLPDGFRPKRDDDGFAMPTFDIDPGDTLQHRSAREHEDERHICPLQLEVTRRCVRLWSNPDEVVWSPFAGIGSEGFVALKEGRRFIGAELKRSYYQQAALNLAEAVRETKRQPDLFDALGG